MKQIRQLLILLFSFSAPIAMLHGQATGRAVKAILGKHLQDGAVVADELQHFLLQRVPPLCIPSDSQQWGVESDQIRENAFSVIYHGWPKQWIHQVPTSKK